jgi:hypothetical protein
MVLNAVKMLLVNLHAYVLLDIPEHFVISKLINAIALLVSTMLLVTTI